MARLFGDGFEFYGGDESMMLDGIYANVDYPTRVSLATDHPATGSWGMRIGANNAAAQPMLRKSLPTSVTKIGAAGHFYFASLPAGNEEAIIFGFLTADPERAQISAIVDSNGRIGFYRGTRHGTSSFYSAGTLVAQSEPVIVAAANNHIEVQCYVHDTLGWVRVAVNGVHQFEATGLDTQYDTTQITGVGQNAWSGSVFYMDNYYVYDFTGDPAVDTDWCPTYDGSGIATGYIGELQAMWQVPDGDTAEDDWVPSTGTDSYAMVDESPADDNDFIYSTAAGDLTEMTLTDLPEDITYIRGIDVWGRMSKSDSGVAQIQFGMKSVADTSDATARPVTVEPTYWSDQINVDPDSLARWTRASFNAAWLRLTRSI